MRRHFERHFVNRAGWLRAAVLGANDGVVSVGSLLVGVAVAHASHTQVLLTGSAGLIAGAMSMAAGEFVSVSSQADSERADLDRERRELASDEHGERAELAGIYRQRGLTPALAEQVAVALMAHDALAAHARDELGLSSTQRARPLLAASASGASFTAGALLPLGVAALVQSDLLPELLVVVALGALALLGAWAARAGGAPVGRAVLRVCFWGMLAMGLTAAVGAWLGRQI